MITSGVEPMHFSSQQQKPFAVASQASPDHIIFFHNKFSLFPTEKQKKKTKKTVTTKTTKTATMKKTTMKTLAPSSKNHLQLLPLPHLTTLYSYMFSTTKIIISNNNNKKNKEDNDNKNKDNKDN